MEKSNENLEKRVLNALSEGGEFSALELNNIAHTTESRAMISRLRRRGNHITDRWTSDGDVRFKKYSLCKGEEAVRLANNL